jgi:hypothetical protein
VISELHALDSRVRSLDLVRPLAVAAMLLACLSAVDFGLALAFALDLDLSVVASCCSVQLDSVASGAAGPASLGAGARHVALVGALVGVAASVILSYRAVRAPTRSRVLMAAFASLAAVPFALAAAVLEVAPHAFEVPQHVCPFCLLRPAAYLVGYPLFGSVFVALTASAGAGLGEVLARTGPARHAVEEFARHELRRGALAWVAAVALGALPIIRYAIVSGGASLFP